MAVQAGPPDRAVSAGEHRRRHRTVLGQKLSQRLGQQFNRRQSRGASGNIGADFDRQIDAGRLHVRHRDSSTHAVAVSLSTKLSYDPIKDFTPDHR